MHDFRVKNVMYDSILLFLNASFKDDIMGLKNILSADLSKHLSVYMIRDL
jgi:hypothetical protein